MPPLSPEAQRMVASQDVQGAGFYMDVKYGGDWRLQTEVDVRETFRGKTSQDSR